MTYLKAVLGIFLLLAFIIFMRPLLFKYFASYTMMIINMVYNDYDRHLNAIEIQHESAWRLHKFEMQFNKQVCKDKPPSRGPVSWLTAMTNDDFVIGAVLNAYMIKYLSCEQKLIALVSNGVTEAGRNALSKAGYDVKVVEPLDCNWMDRKKGRKEQNLGIIGTHMRFHAWNYTKFNRIIYFDADILPLTSIDELFDLDTDLGAAYCGKPGVLDPCFNAGILVFKPSSKYYQEIMDMWSKLSDNGCPNDQVLLWHYYADNGRWTPIPYAYNVRREIYHPLKVYHFACCLTPKAWRVLNPPTKIQLDSFEGPIKEPMQMVLLWWKYFLRALNEFDLHSWWKVASLSIRRKDH